MSELIKAFSRSDDTPERIDATRSSHSGAVVPEVIGQAQLPAPSTVPQHRQMEQHGADSPDSTSLDEVFARLWRRRIAIAAAAVLGALVSLGISTLWKPVYRARTAIRLEQLNDQFPNMHEIFPATSDSADDMYLQNELKILESDDLAGRVAARLGIQPPERHAPTLLAGTPLGGILTRYEASRRTLSPDDLRIKAVQRALTVRPSLKSEVVEIYFDAGDPAAAALGANTVVSEYIAINREARMKTSQDTTEWLAGQIADLKTKLNDGNAQLQAFARSAGLLYASDDTLLTEDATRQTQEALSKAQADRDAKQSLYETAIANSPEALPSSDNGLLRDYESKLATVEGELTQLRAIYTPAHYKVVDAEAREAQLQAAIKQERQRIIARMRADYEAANRYEQSLSKTFTADTRKLTEETSDAFRYNVLKRDLESTQQLYNSLIQKAREAGVASAMHATSVRIIDSARPPAGPFSPNLPLNGAIGFSGGLLLAVGIVLVRDRDTYLGIQNADSPLSDVRELGTIPSAKRNQSFTWPANNLFTPGKGNSSVELITWQEPPSLLTEAFRATLASILFSPGFARQHAVLTVTSVQPLEGKTTTISNLAIALTETHGRVLLIDADLRRPRIHKIFDHCNDKGLTTILTSEDPVSALKLDDLIRETNIPGLFTLPSGPGTASITPLLYSARMTAFLARARAEYDFVLIDTPPSSLFSDARILGKLSDAVIVVVHATKTSRGDLKAACQNFAKDGTHILGTVVNHWNAARRHRVYAGYKQA